MMEYSEIIDFTKGDKKTFKVIFQSLYSTMCLYANKYLTNQYESEDVCQEVFVELWHQRDKFENYNQIKAFLYISIKNKCLNIIKHLKVETNYKNKILYLETEDDIQVIEVEVINQLNNAIEKLPDQQRMVIFYSMQGMKNEEIADVMQISINTVKLHKKTAYQTLRKTIDYWLFLLLL
jgi:RNA polymerase sigma-70 factor (family 1)